MTVKRYVGVVQLLADPMTLSQYYEYRGGQMPIGPNPDEPGYCVQYLELDHHIAWVAKETFEKIFREVDV